MFKQFSRLNGEIICEIECLDCRKYNYVSEEFYYHIKSDHQVPLVQPINNKMPYEMNVIFVSMERAGISWIIRELSKFHEKMFGKPIIFTKNNAEISHLIAIRNRFPLPKGWNNVYNIDPQSLLDRVDPDGNKYDRIVVIHRNLKTFQNVYKIKLSQERLDPNFIEKIIRKTPEEYELVYHEIEDPRLLRVDLWDLNQYTDACFNELMDFLNFPTHNRPPVVRTKTLPFEVLIEAYSSVWGKDFKLTGMLGRVEGIFQLTNDGILEYIAKEVMERNMNEIVLENILIIGPGFHKNCHFSENMFYAFKKKGYNIELLDMVKLGWGTKESKDYQDRKKMYLISKALEFIDFTPELIIFDEPAFFFQNDVDIPVFYYHREYKRPPTIYHPDIVFFWHQGVLNMFKSINGFPYWSVQPKEMKIIYPGLNPDQFEVKEKTIHGVSCLGGRETMKGCLEMREHKAQEYLTQSVQEIIKYIDLGLQWIESDKGGLTDEKFRELLPTCESLWICFPLGQYISRRILEAMICKVVCIMRLESEEHRDTLKKMGFIANEHYIEIQEISDMVELNKNWNYDDYKDMVDKAHDVVINRHTFDKKVDFIVNEYKEFIFNYRKVII